MVRPIPEEEFSMALPGTIVRHGGKLAFESTSPMLNEPKLVRHVWELATAATSGMCWRAPEDSIGKPATIQDGRVSCYLGQGCYLSGTLADGGATRAIIVETIPIPCPKVRAGIETRWHNGQWQKLLKTGWRNA
jgi:hypothetical protein